MGDRLGAKSAPTAFPKAFALSAKEYEQSSARLLVLPDMTVERLQPDRENLKPCKSADDPLRADVLAEHSCD